MVLVFFIFVIISILILIIIASTISIRIDKLNISNVNVEYKTIFDFKIYFELLFLNKIKIFSIMLNKEKVNKINNKMNFKNKIKNMDFKRIKNDFPKANVKEIIKKLDINVSKFILRLEIGTENVILTSGLITIISSVLGIVLARVINKFEKDKYVYEINPMYQNKNLINLHLNCIIKVKMVHIISIIYLLLKRRVDSNERSSNRRSYDYSYE